MPNNYIFRLSFWLGSARNSFIWLCVYFWGSENLTLRKYRGIETMRREIFLQSSLASNHSFHSWGHAPLAESPGVAISPTPLLGIYLSFSPFSSFPFLHLFFSFLISFPSFLSLSLSLLPKVSSRHHSISSQFLKLIYIQVQTDVNFSAPPYLWIFPQALNVLVFHLLCYTLPIVLSQQPSLWPRPHRQVM